jgi:NAD(P)-dependent dehydrogenase (short-subunit alcohol dehydrogenase family)
MNAGHPARHDNPAGATVVRLENKTAVIYGAGGGIGAAVAQAFAREGARVFITGRNPAKLEPVAKAIRAAGGRAEAAQVDALGEQSIDKHLDAVTAKAGGYTRTNFFTARLAARRMVAKKAGVILTVTPIVSRTGIPLLGGFALSMGMLDD